jgi:drug/metabolite transporter (DMT)-like permease
VLLFIGEKPSALALVGGALVLSAVTLRARQRILDGRRASESGRHT